MTDFKEKIRAKEAVQIGKLFFCRYLVKQKEVASFNINKNKFIDYQKIQPLLNNKNQSYVISEK